FVWTEGAQSKLFVASGIGITPFISILKARQRDGGDLNLRLIYAGREVELPFEAWLKHLAAKQPQFKLSLIHGRRLQLQDLEAANRDLVYLSGPADMVNQLDEQLMAVGLPRQNLKRDLFTGSPGWSNY
ncbi:MAG TPA: hypothetical protein VFK03_01060, partial [Candidatus Saccharimonadales bacterium]|nr:hypothetical protein [Candidatus Saccharimonadales bacterium]